MNKDIHSLSEAYNQASKKGIVLENKYNPWAVCTAAVGREDKSKYEKCVKGVKKQEDAEESDEHELGVDPKEAEVYDKAKQDISYENYAFWDAYHAVKEGAWSEDDFVQWARSVWSDGASNA